MKRWQFLGTGALAVALLWGALANPAWSQGRGQGFRACPYAPYMCPVKATCKPFEESGRVVRTLTESLEEGMYPGLAVIMETKTKGPVHVSLGPVWYLERQEFELKPGDEVRVRGMCEQEKDKDGKLRVVAYELSRGDFVLALRDAQGRPYWEAWRRK